MVERKRKLHKTYFEHSPAYRQAFEAHGGSVPLVNAEAFLADHGLEWDALEDDLTEQDFEHDGLGNRTRVHTLALFLAMGY